MERGGRWLKIAATRGVSCDTAADVAIRDQALCRGKYVPKRQVLKQHTWNVGMGSMNHT